MTITALYPGTFDPITYGHIDLIKRASGLFSTLLIAVADNKMKPSLFSQEQRIAFIKDSITFDNVLVYPLNGLLVDFAKTHQAHVVVRGLRSISDFDYELQMAKANRQLSGNLETVFLTAGANKGHVSSSLVREILSYQGDVSAFVPDSVIAALNQ